MNYDYFELKFDRISLDAGQSNHTSEQPGQQSGLQLVLDVQQDEYLISNSQAVGFRVSNVVVRSNGQTRT